MEDEITEVVAVPVEQGTNVATSTGGVTGAPANTGKQFTQDQLDSVVKSRIAEERKRLEAKFKETADRQVAAAKDEAAKDLDKMVTARLAEVEAKQKLDAQRMALGEKYGLNEKQVARLNGTTPEELAADAAELFGKFVPQPDPVADARKAVQERLALTDKQMARLEGDTEEALLADAEEVFGRKPTAAVKPPVLKPGPGTQTPPAPSDLADMDPADIRKNWRKVWPSPPGS